MLNNLGQLASLMKNAGKIRENLEKTAEELSKLSVEGSAGGGAVVVKANGRLEILSVRIDPKLLGDTDVELLEELVAAAVNQTLTKGKEAAARSISTVTGGLPIPGLDGLFN